jgi:hypothetical protein
VDICLDGGYVAREIHYTLNRNQHKNREAVGLRVEVDSKINHFSDMDENDA